MNKHSELTDATRQAFIDAFVLINKVKSIEKITIKELTDKAGYNRTTFYNYFTDIYSLYEYVEWYVFSQVRGQIKENMRQVNDRRKFIQTFTKQCIQWKEYLVIVLNNPFSQRFTVQVKEQMILYWIEEFQLPNDDIKIQYKLDFYLSALFSIMSRWLKNQEDMQLDELAELLQEIITEGVLSGI